MANAVAKYPTHVWTTWKGIELTKADAWVTVATLIVIALLGGAGIVGAVIVSSNPNASLLVPMILASSAATVPALLNFMNGRNTARKVDELRDTARKIDEQTNGGLTRNVEEAVHRAAAPAVEKAITRILNGRTKRAGEPHAGPHPPEEIAPDYR